MIYTYRSFILRAPLETSSMHYEYQKQAPLCSESKQCELLVKQRNENVYCWHNNGKKSVYCW